MNRWIYLYDKKSELLSKKYKLEKIKLEDLLLIVTNNGNDLTLAYCYDLTPKQVNKITESEGNSIDSSEFDNYDFFLESNISS